MVLNNAKNRTPKLRKNSYLWNPESYSRILEDASRVSTEYGTNQITANGEDSDERDPNPSRSSSKNGISGKIVSQLIEETEKQLAYHEQQAELFKERLQELNQINLDTE